VGEVDAVEKEEVVPGRGPSGDPAPPPGKLPASGTRVGIPWLGWTCGACDACRRGQENLCAGLIGYRSYGMAGKGGRLGLYGFGAAAHLLAQVAVHQGREVYAFTRPGDEEAQAFARSLGAAILFAPVGGLVPAALRAVRPGGTVVCAGIHMSDIPSFPYRILWEERVLRSVANLTRADGHAFLEVVGETRIRAETIVFPLEEANEALRRLRDGELQGAAVLVP
jgi:alcohol dehydrogenase, propanol-preferring